MIIRTAKQQKFCMPLTDKQKEIFDDDSRFRVVCSGRRGGKTYLTMWEIAKFARYPNKRIYCVFPTYRQAKTVLWEDLKTQMLKRNWVKKINESDLSITLVNNSKVFLRSGENFDTLRGISIDLLIMDEAAMIDERCFREVLRPALSDRKGHAIFVTTPKGAQGWFYELYQDAAHLEDWARFTYTTLEGGLVDAVEIEAAKRELSEKDFKQEYEASFESYSGLIYYNWNAETNVTANAPEIGDRTLLHIGMDFNVDPLVACIATVEGNNITIFDEIVINGSNTFEMCEEIQRKYPNNRVYAYPDASGQARKTSSKTTDHMIMRNAGFTLKVKGNNPPVLDRIASVNANLKSAEGDIRLHITPNCKNVIKSISQQVYKEGTRIPEKDGKIDHMSDAVGYLVHWLNPIRGPQVHNQPVQRFAHF